MTTPIRKIVLCADDFGQSEQISLGIIELITSRRLTATSVMTEAPYWPLGAAQLNKVHKLADIGLHINLTHEFKGSDAKQPLAYWLVLSQLKLLSRKKLTRKICYQIDLFTKHFGRLPDFIDGHQHLHAFPVIRDALTDAIAVRWPQGSALPWVRAPEQLIDNGDVTCKAAVLRIACRGFSEHLRTKGLTSTAHFGGLYSLSTYGNFSGLFKHWLHTAPHGTVIMCHPGRETSDHDDPIDAIRPLEYDYLASPEFAEECRLAGVELARYSQIAAE
jgi:chitin disaccharide deacetylase